MSRQAFSLLTSLHANYQKQCLLHIKIKFVLNSNRNIFSFIFLFYFFFHTLSVQNFDCGSTCIPFIYLIFSEESTAEE